MLYRDANGDVTDVSPGSDGNVLTLVGGVPAWAAAADQSPAFLHGDPSVAVYSALIGAAAPATPGTRGAGGFSLSEFSDSQDQSIVWQFAMPTFYGGGDLQADVYWTSESAGGSDTDGNVAWEGAMERLSDVGPINLDTAAFGTVLSSTGTFPAARSTGDIVKTTLPLFDDATKKNSVIAGELFRFALARDAAVANNFADAVHLVGVVFHEV